MTDHDESRPPLTRREIRLREMAAVAATAAASEAASAAPEPVLPEVHIVEEISPDPISAAVAEAIASANFEFSLVDETGRPRSRKELRELRQRAEEELTEKVIAETGAIELGAVYGAGEGVPAATAPAQPVALAAQTPVEPAAPVEPAPEVQAEPKIDYSFPDITPIDEPQSVFDDPATRLVSPVDEPSGEPTGDFDDLITHAVAQESAATSTNTSALIIPSLPDADVLSGALGDTGELFITGSINLPRSIGETGGHSSLHDSVEVEPLLDDLGFAEPTPTGTIMTPVSATRAVSARGKQGPLVAESVKDKSKLPAVLISIGGVLVLAAVGLVVWAAMNGLFG